MQPLKCVCAVALLSAITFLLLRAILLRCRSQLPTWYELWWDNGYYPGQPAADFMFGAWPGNMTEVGLSSPSARLVPAMACARCQPQHLFRDGIPKPPLCQTCGTDLR